MEVSKTKIIDGRSVKMTARVPDEGALECGFLLMELDSSRDLQLNIGTIVSAGDRIESELERMLEKEFEKL